MSSIANAQSLDQIYKQKVAQGKTQACQADIAKKYQAVHEFAAAKGTTVSSIEDRAKNDFGRRGAPMNSCQSSIVYIQFADGRVCSVEVLLEKPMIDNSDSYPSSSRIYGSCQ